MDSYITASAIKKLREKKGITQAELAQKIGVSDKTISKWETAKGLPDISLIEPLAKELGVSVIEIMSGDYITNRNISCNMLRSKFYLCPVCGNIIHSSGESLIGCCGITLPPLEAEECDGEHTVLVEKVEDEHFITVNHPMEKSHFITFIAYVTGDRCQFVKLYPEGNAQTRLNLRGKGVLYICCNRHGLMKCRL
ncbi:MAG: helix-turn-helix domain-containing protein [Oscillospiraceae bacterium]|nr:helix-turn-helix domain-containing protein [Oscillospiraceae bacterium]